MEPIKQEGNPEIDTTRFVNIDVVPYDIYIGGKLARRFEPAQEQVVPVYVAQVGAKHLVDRILQNDPYKVKDTNVDTPLRRSLFAKILPDMAEERQIVPLTPEQERTQLKELIERQETLIRSFTKQQEDKEKMREELKAELLEELRAELPASQESVSETPTAKKVGRPKKATEEKVAE